MVRSSRRWKESEKAVAMLLHGKRVTHDRGLAMEDVSHPLFSVEVKSREYIPKWLTEAVKQAQRNAPKEKVAIVVVHHVNHQHADDLVIVRLCDFVDLMGGINVHKEDC